MQEKQRERLNSRLGFILVSAGCAIGLGNVYRFPITAGSYGGSVFIIIYLAFLILLGVPILTCELSVGRLSQRSIATSFDVLEKPNQKWHLMKYLGISGNYLLMMFYTTICSWFVSFFIKYCDGSIMQYKTNEELTDVFANTVSNPYITILATCLVIVVCFIVCSFGLQNGVEKVTKVLMALLFLLMFGLVIYSLTLSNALEGLKFYLVPNFESVEKVGLLRIISSALGQAFFTLSIGMGSIAVFGSYIGKDRKLLGESITIVSLDTLVAIMSGFIIFPACFTYGNGIDVDAGNVGASFLFTNLASVFNHMNAGRIVGACFFMFLIFAAVSTIIAVFESIMSFWLELTNLKRGTISVINILIVVSLSLPAMLSSNILADVNILGMSILDCEDYIVSNVILPLGGLIYVVFCSWDFGIGFDRFITETNTGEKGIAFPRWAKQYMKYVVPVIIIFILVVSILGVK